MRKTMLGILVAVGALAGPGLVRAAQPPDPAAPLAAVYQELAGTILAANATEGALIHSILHAEHDAAIAALDRAAAKGGTTKDLAEAAERIGDFATEGGAAIEPIRNRLLKGGHHHNSDDVGAEAAYDEGYVMVTRKAKQELLPIAKRAAKAGEAGSVDAAEVKAIREAFVAASGKVLTAK